MARLSGANPLRPGDISCHTPAVAPRRDANRASRHPLVDMHSQRPVRTPHHLLARHASFHSSVFKTLLPGVERQQQQQRQGTARARYVFILPANDSP
ncbi:hypothetical protein AAFF_G00432360 [Aldrovandia affinis]|uniref:Uncharacterized protein n=1 Tax=Aldrovandia affinis TaxID=143900 RepID=A0AAD7WJ24_9TELE|nr:hypothetical protein AAFF_G00432360 [Aldrovandia affinis]